MWRSLRLSKAYRLTNNNKDGTWTYEAEVLKQIAVLKDGDYFGEAAIDSQKPRMATMRCLEDTHLAVLNNKDYKAIMKEYNTRKHNELATYIKSYEFMQHFTKQTIKRISYFLQKKEHWAGNTIFKQGDSVTGFYLVKGGEFEISIKIQLTSVNKKTKTRQIDPRTINKTKYKEVRVMIFGENDYFGLYQSCQPQSHVM